MIIRQKFWAFMFVLVFILSMPSIAYACCSCVQKAGGTSSREWFSPGTGTQDVVKNHLDAEFNAQEVWMVSILFEDNILPAMMLMTEQLTVVAMSQVHIFGGFLDAKHQLESQRILATLTARAHKDYHPSVGMCEFGSMTKSLASSERKGEIASLALAKRSQDRQLGSPYTSASYGLGMDKDSRVQKFVSTYCNPRDQNNGLWLMCRGVTTPEANAGTEEEIARFNKDIDYGSTVDSPWTINADFTDTSIRDQEEDVISLASYLYAHNTFRRPAAVLLSLPSDGRPGSTMTSMQKAYMDLRSIVAKRSVAENSYNAIVGMKTSGTEGSRDYLEAALKELGITEDAEIDSLIGDVDPPANPSDPDVSYYPSYYAQMEILTKKIYQNPDFYTNLYDKPANVARKNVALQAIGLMQKFDMFKSYLRSEASLSVLLELAVMDLQDGLENDSSGIDSSSEPLPP